MEATVQEPKPNVILRLPGHGWDGGSQAIDDPGLSMFAQGFTVAAEHFFLTLTEYESDIWVMNLEW